MKPDLASLEGLVVDGDEPVFNEPWEAQAFAMAINLHENGLFTWSQWVDALSSEVHSGTERDYYHHWLTALEKLVAQKQLITPEAITAREKQWHEAAARTPHGKPIEL